MALPLVTGRRRLPLLLVGNAMMRIASGAGAVLVGLYLAELANRGFAVDAVLVGTLGAVSFIAELIAALPMGVLSDAIAPRVLMTGGALLGAIATQLFGFSGMTTIFFLSRTLEGLGAAAGTPSILAHLTDITEGDEKLRSKAMSFFELSLLAGLALGGLVGGTLWKALNKNAFAAVAAVYLLCAVLLAVSAVGSKKHGVEQALSGLAKALREPSLRRLAPAWLCMNAIVGLWLGPTVTFLFTLREHRGQYLTGVFVDHPDQIGWMLLIYAMVFATGVSAWSFIMPYYSRQRVLQIALVAMLFVCVGLYALNHSQDWSSPTRWVVIGILALFVMVESGFTPTALALLADVVGAHAGRGAAMGIYSVLLSIGALVGSFMAGLLGKAFEVDGLIYGTMVMALIAMLAVKSIKQLTRMSGNQSVLHEPLNE
jgi:MFS family permease